MINEIKESGFHPIPVDEVSPNNEEILSISMRFVNKEMSIKEIFLVNIYEKLFWTFMKWQELILKHALDNVMMVQL